MQGMMNVRSGHLKKDNLIFRGKNKKIDALKKGGK